MGKTLITSRKRPSKGQFDIVGNHARDAAAVTATDLDMTVKEFQDAVIMSGPELQRDFQRVLRATVEAHRRVTQPNVLQRKPFDPKKFLGSGWSIAEQIGKRSGGNLDAGNIVRKDYLHKGESSINGVERLCRIKATPADIQLDGEDFLALYEEQDQLTLRWLCETQGITYLSFWSIILQDIHGYRRVLSLHGWHGSSWLRGDFMVDSEWGSSHPSAVLPSLPAAA